jgi:hypothetical protein
MTTEKALKLALEAAYLSGFNASGEGYNGECPFGDRSERPEQNKNWCAERDDFINQALAAPVQEPVGEVKDLFTQAAWEKLDVRGSTKVYLGTPFAAQPAPEEPHKVLSEHLAQATNGRVYVDPVTGDVGIGTPAAPDLQAELDATNRQVEILSDALAESRREVDAMIALARADEREKAKHNEEVLINALWKACGDDGQLVEETIESQGKLK